MTLLRLRLAAVAIVALIAAAVAGLVATPGGSGSGRTPVTAPTPQPTTPTRTPPTSAAATPTPARTSATPAPSTLAADSIAIPRQHVVAAIDVCQIVNSELEPPADVRRTCFWLGGAPVTATVGTTVITGHVNWVGQGTGALGRIDELHAGDTVVTTDSRSRAQRWVIRSVVHRPKTLGIDTAAFAGRAGSRQLYLITCGGAFDADARSYLDNIYVRAVPA